MGFMFFVLELFFLIFFSFSREDFDHLGMLVSFGLGIRWYSIHVSQHFAGRELRCF